MLATIRPFTLGGGNGPTGTVTWKMSAGSLTVYHADSAAFVNINKSNAPPPATWTQAGKIRHFTTVFDAARSARLASSPAPRPERHFKITAAGYAPLAKGKAACSARECGRVKASGASIAFTASGPMTKG